MSGYTNWSSDAHSASLEDIAAALTDEAPLTILAGAAVSLFAPTCIPAAVAWKESLLATLFEVANVRISRLDIKNLADARGVQLETIFDALERH